MFNGNPWNPDSILGMGQIDTAGSVQIATGHSTGVGKLGCIAFIIILPISPNIWQFGLDSLTACHFRH